MAKKQDKKKKVRTSLEGNCVVAAVDFSEFSEGVVQYAALWARATKSKLVVLHVVHDPADTQGYYADVAAKKQKKVMKTIVQRAEEVMAKFMEEMRTQHSKDDVIAAAQAQLVSGVPVRRIIEVAKERKATMLVVGSHGRTGISRLLLGSKAQRIAHLSRVPVTIVKG